MTSYKYETVLLPSSRKKVTIPVDKDGYVPEEALIERSKARGPAYAKRDYEERADIVLPIKVTPRQAAPWWASMDHYDIEDIDVPGRPRSDIGERTGRNAEIHRMIKVYGTPSEEKKVRSMIDDSFPLSERAMLVKDGAISVHVKPLGPGLLGKTDKKTWIELNRSPNGCNNGTVVHEGSHILRLKDGSRTDAISRSTDVLKMEYTGKSKNPKVRRQEVLTKRINLEESCTVAEQLAREQDGQHESGYYADVPVKDMKTGRWRKPTTAEITLMIKQDRRLFRNGGGKPLTEKAAVESVEKNWARSHIARLKTGKSMAINDMAAVNPKVVPLPKVKRSKSSSGSKKTAPAKKPVSRKTAAKPVTVRVSPKPAVRVKPVSDPPVVMRGSDRQTSFAEKTGARTTSKKKTTTGNTSFGAMLQKKADNIGGKKVKKK